MGAEARKEIRLLNFVLVGELRSGTSVVQTSLCNRPGAVCHGDLFHTDVEVRRAAHEAYFGPAKNPQTLPEWYVEGEVSPWRYINHVVLDNPRNGECAVGFRILYPEVRRWELFELFEARCRRGNFCVIHVKRNPVACLTSLKQAQRSGIWTRTWNSSPQTSCPGSVSLDVHEVIEFCRSYASLQSKIRAVCSDFLEVSYRNLFLNYQGVMRKVFRFLELPDSEEPAVPMCRRLRNRTIRERILNWDRLYAEAPCEVRELLDSEDLF